MIIVLAFGMSSPFSMIVVATQHVVLSRHEVDHHLLELVLAHLAVADHDSRLGHEALHEAGDRVDRLDAVVHQIDLAAALQLVPNRVADHLLVERHDVGLDRQAVAAAASR